jgi:hypothetical protein
MAAVGLLVAVSGVPVGVGHTSTLGFEDVSGEARARKEY